MAVLSQNVPYLIEKQSKKRTPPIGRNGLWLALILLVIVFSGALFLSAMMQVSRTPRTTFDLRAALRGVGEALKREIAGMVLVGQPGLWGFEDCSCIGFGWE